MKAKRNVNLKKTIFFVTIEKGFIAKGNQ